MLPFEVTPKIENSWVSVGRWAVQLHDNLQVVARAQTESLKDRTQFRIV
jgi:hypothetical protein